MRLVSLLGSTGSIGTQTLDVVRANRDKFEVVAISANSSINLLLEQIKKLNQNKTDKNEYCSTFSGQNIKKKKKKFTGSDLTAVFGGIECDLRKAIIEEDVVINASSIFGGIDIYVPENANVKVKSSSKYTLSAR